MNSDIIDIWSTKLAEVATPNELDLAPLMTEAFIRGGKERESLFTQRKDSVLGGFGVTEVAIVFPYILQGIANTAQLITMILSPVSAIKNLKEILTEMRDKQEMASLNSQKMEVLPEELYTGLRIVLQTFTDEISKSGLPREKCELITYHALLKLLEEPSSSTLFVNEISKHEKSES
jgi:hypothetical protein